MQAYEYQALTDTGSTTRGVVQADSARAARAQLRERGLMPLAVGAVEGERRQAFVAAGSGRERALLLRQMSALLKAGLPLEEVLSVLVEQSDRARSRRRHSGAGYGGSKPVGGDERASTSVSDALHRIGRRW